MRLSDIMSAMALSSYAEVALVIFMIVFMAVALRLLSKRHEAQWNAARYMPLDDLHPIAPQTRGGDHKGNDR